LWLAQAVMEFHLIAARRDMPINSENSGRPNTDCAAEDRQREQPLDRGAIYVYFDGNVPAAQLFPGGDPSASCTMLGAIAACRP
jgi:hypothetical protein